MQWLYLNKNNNFYSLAAAAAQQFMVSRRDISADTEMRHAELRTTALLHIDWSCFNIMYFNLV